MLDHAFAQNQRFQHFTVSSPPTNPRLNFEGITNQCRPFAAIASENNFLRRMPACLTYAFSYRRIEADAYFYRILITKHNDPGTIQFFGSIEIRLYFKRFTGQLSPRDALQLKGTKILDHTAVAQHIDRSANS